MNSLVVGLQYGDEGKGRVAACFSENHDWCVRFNGGPNAGHTVWHNGIKHALHHLPAGTVLGKKIALDAGMVININTLLDECRKVNRTVDELYISENVHIIQERHIENDAAGSGIGSTKRGIAYVYSDRALRNGVRAGDYRGHSLNTYRGLPPIQKNESALYESAQGIMLDIDYGCYPYVTSSSVFPSSLHKIDKKIGVMKAYTSRVGDGPPNVPEVDWLCPAGAEYGTTTGRARRCTWAILDELKYAISLLNPDEIVVTKLDILKDEENICVWNNNELYNIGNLDLYKDFLLSKFPQIKYFSESADGNLIKV